MKQNIIKNVAEGKDDDDVVTIKVLKKWKQEIEKLVFPFVKYSNLEIYSYYLFENKIEERFNYGETKISTTEKGIIGEPYTLKIGLNGAFTIIAKIQYLSGNGGCFGTCDGKNIFGVYFGSKYTYINKEMVEDLGKIEENEEYVFSVKMFYNHIKNKKVKSLLFRNYKTFDFCVKNILSHRPTKIILRRMIIFSRMLEDVEILIMKKEMEKTTKIITNNYK